MMSNKLLRKIDYALQRNDKHHMSAECKDDIRELIKDLGKESEE